MLRTRRPSLGASWLALPRPLSASSAPKPSGPADRPVLLPTRRRPSSAVCSLRHIRLQPPSHGVAASLTRGCSVPRIGVRPPSHRSSSASRLCAARWSTRARSCSGCSRRSPGATSCSPPPHGATTPPRASPAASARAWPSTPRCTSSPSSAGTRSSAHSSGGASGSALATHRSPREATTAGS